MEKGTQETEIIKCNTSQKKEEIRRTEEGKKNYRDKLPPPASSSAAEQRTQIDTYSDAPPTTPTCMHLLQHQTKAS